MEQRFKTGLVVGKFYPLHQGHQYLIETAQSRCEHLTIMLCSRSDELIPGTLREQWLRRLYPAARVVHAPDVPLGDGDSKGWAHFTIKLLGAAPEAVFTSESYGDTYARYLGCTHVPVDKLRTKVPISGTKVRAAPRQHLHFLHPIVRANFITRICVLGAESTGTTTLARDLAAHYKTAWVPEYGRTYSEGKFAAGNDWGTDEFVHIAQAQQSLEDMLAQQCEKVLVCDTDAFATTLWHERYMGSASDAVARIADSRPYDLYILTGDEIPFVQDGLRDGEHIRHAMQSRFKQRLAETGRPYLEVNGSPRQRLAASIAAIDAILNSREPLDNKKLRACGV